MIQLKDISLCQARFVYAMESIKAGLSSKAQPEAIADRYREQCDFSREEYVSIKNELLDVVSFKEPALPGLDKLYTPMRTYLVDLSPDGLLSRITGPEWAWICAETAEDYMYFMHKMLAQIVYPVKGEFDTGEGMTLKEISEDLLQAKFVHCFYLFWSGMLAATTHFLGYEPVTNILKQVIGMRIVAHSHSLAQDDLLLQEINKAISKLKND